MLSLKTKGFSSARDVIRSVCREICLSFSRTWRVHTKRFSALRRQCATFRRKTNMYAKATTGLQRLLHVYWVVHNFLRVHFTTREVPAVALGLLERRLSVQEIFQIQMA